MVRRSRNLCLYPNVYLMDQFSSQIRTYRPIAVDKTEVTIYCIAPKGESAEARARRIRQYEDFFNASGMATPDDLEEFRACQNVLRGPGGARGTTCPAGPRTGSRAPTRRAEAIGLKPLMSGVRTEDEGLFIVQHKYWQEAMKRAMAAEATENRKRAVAGHDEPCPLGQVQAIPLPRGPRPRRQGVGRLARLLRAGRRVLDAVLGRRRQARHRPADARFR